MTMKHSEEFTLDEVFRRAVGELFDAGGGVRIVQDRDGGEAFWRLEKRGGELVLESIRWRKVWRMSELQAEAKAEMRAEFEAALEAAGEVV